MKYLLSFCLLFLFACNSGSNNENTGNNLPNPEKVEPPSDAIPRDMKIKNDSVVVPRDSVLKAEAGNADTVHH